MTPPNLEDDLENELVGTTMKTKLSLIPEKVETREDSKDN